MSILYLNMLHIILLWYNIRGLIQSIQTSDVRLRRPSILIMISKRTSILRLFVTWEHIDGFPIYFTYLPLLHCRNSMMRKWFNSICNLLYAVRYKFRKCWMTAWFGHWGRENVRQESINYALKVWYVIVLADWMKTRRKNTLP